MRVPKSDTAVRNRKMQKTCKSPSHPSPNPRLRHKMPFVTDQQQYQQEVSQVKEGKTNPAILLTSSWAFAAEISPETAGQRRRGYAG